MTLSYEIEFAAANEVANDCDESPFDAKMLGYIFRTLGPYLGGENALQVGSYGPNLCEWLTQLYDGVTVVEPATRLIERARRTVGNHVLFQQTLFETFRTFDRYDAVFLFHVLEQAVHPVTSLARTRVFLKEHGRAFIVAPNANAASRQIAVRMGILPEVGALSEDDERRGARRTYNLESLERDVVAAGMRVVSSGGIFFKPFGNEQLDRMMGGPIVTDAYLEGCYAMGKKYPDLCANVFVVAER